MPRDLPDCADIEIIEHRESDSLDGGSLDGGNGILIPREVRINGKPVLMPKDHPPKIHEIEIGSHEPVLVTLTVFARSVSIRHEQTSESPDAPTKRWSVWDLTDNTLVVTLRSGEPPFVSIPLADHLAKHIMNTPDPGRFVLTEDNGPHRATYGLNAYEIVKEAEDKRMDLVWLEIKS
ncbi:hypothetical protein [Nocardia otitidiscaviarum]|uniref:hypothetical protein n=1 Tax=Nocardia otitidiscaviarum TaxID=1823 RepID=UPI0004A6E2C7|nr:hypothetical protein [Nocardia otitidiscaviarum]